MKGSTRQRDLEKVEDLLIFLNVFLFLEQPKRSGRKQTTGMSSLINYKIRGNYVPLPNDRGSPSVNPTGRRARLTLIQ